MANDSLNLAGKIYITKVIFNIGSKDFPYMINEFRMQNEAQ